MADRKRKRKPGPVTACLPMVAVLVPDPGRAGGTVVNRVLDTVLQMRRSGQITVEQYEAAETYRAAYELVRAGMGGVMDPDRCGGGSASGRIPASAVMAAADTLADATKALNAVCGTVVVEMVVGQGYSIDDAAGSLFGRGPDGKASQRNRDHVAAFLRLALEALAKLWRRAPRRIRANT